MVGTPHTNNYTLGRGELSFSLFSDPNTQKPAGFRYVGDTPEFAINTATTNLDHYNSDHGIKIKDQSIVLEINRTGTFTTDDISMDNLALLYFGTKQTNTTTTATVTAEALGGKSFQGSQFVLGMTAANPAGIRNLATFVSLQSTATTPVVYVSGTDYTVDLTTGLLTLIPLSQGGTIPDGTSLTASYTVAATQNQQVISSNNPIEGALLFTSYNPAGNKIDYFLPWVKLAPDGDYNLKGDTWQQIKFKMDILEPKDGRAGIYANGRAYTGVSPY